MIRVITSFCCLLLLDYFHHAKAKHPRFTYQCAFALPLLWPLRLWILSLIWLRCLSPLFCYRIRRGCRFALLSCRTVEPQLRSDNRWMATRTCICDLVARSSRKNHWLRGVDEKKVKMRRKKTMKRHPHFSYLRSWRFLPWLSVILVLSTYAKWLILHF